MDKINSFQETIMCVLRKRASYINQSLPEERHLETAFDLKNKLFLLLDVGWRDRKRVLSIDMYIQIKEDKIWIEADESEDGIAGELLAKGVLSQDIVLGFYHQSRRELTEFAAPF